MDLGITGMPAFDDPQTVAFWMTYTTAPASYQSAFTFFDDGTGRLKFGLRMATIAVWRTGGAVLSVAAPAAGWHHVAYTFDGQTQRLYVDGTSFDTSTAATDTGAVTGARLGAHLASGTRATSTTSASIGARSCRPRCRRSPPASSERYPSAMADDKRVYSEQEVGELVQRAAELQERSSERGLHYAAGVTREQLERVAQEVGVEPEFLARALAERSEAQLPGFFRQHERVVDGEIDPSNFDLILKQVQARRSRRRITTQIGRTLSAQVWTGSGLANLEVTSRNARTRVRVKPRPVFEIMATLYPAFLATLMGAMPLAANGHGLASALVAAGSFTAGTLAFLGWTKRSNRAAKRLADKVEGVVAAEVARQGTAAESEVSEEERRRRLAARKEQLE